MLAKSRAIVFRTHKYGETSLIVELYTEERGLRKYVMNGVRSSKARTKANLLQLMNPLEVVAYERDDRELNRLKEVRPAFIYQAIPFDVRRGAVGLFMIELARKAIREREENRPLFQFLYKRFIGLDQTAQAFANYHLAFMLELSTFLGFQPAGRPNLSTPIFDLREGCFVPRPPGHHDYIVDEPVLAIWQLLQTTAAEAHQVKLKRETRQQTLQHLIRFYQFHLEGMGEMNAHEILKTIF